MQITLINCLAKLQAKGINMALGSGVDTLCAQLQSLVPLQSFGYEFAADKISIDAPDGTLIPDLSAFGDVVTI